MSQPKYYLKQNVYMEPLINQWYAWGNLVPPHTYAMFLANLHLKILQSYLQSPQMHANAVKNPKMIGGPFIDLPGNQTAVVKELMEKTKSAEADMLALAEAIKNLDNLLANEAKGHSMLALHDKIPHELRGYVELGYDLNNQPSIRFIEGLFYKSPYFRPEKREGIRLGLAEKDERAFVLSTPRFPDKDHLHYQIPFSSPEIDRLFEMKFTPKPMSEVEAFMPDDPAEQAFFRSMFTEKAPEKRGTDRDQLGDKVRVRYFGHAVLLMETQGVSIMTDPCVSYTIPDKTVPRYTYEDLPETIDYVIITHNHQDHILYETLLPLRHKIKNIVVPRSNGGSLQDPSVKLFLEQAGFKSVIELDEMESIPLADGAITGLPFFGEHGELHVRSKLAYHVRLHGQSFMCAADSNNLVPEVYDFIRNDLGPTDTIFLGMECAGAPMSWLYGPMLTKPLERRMDQSRRLDGSDAERGVRLIESMGGKSVYVYAMGQEPWLKFISSISYTETSKPIVESNKLMEECRNRGINADRPYGKMELIL